VRTIVAHMIDVLGFYALHLASGSPVRLRVDVRPHDAMSNPEMLNGRTGLAGCQSAAWTGPARE